MSSVSPDLYLSPDQQNLLLAALSSNDPSSMYLSNSLPNQHTELPEDLQYLTTSPSFDGIQGFTDQKFHINGVPTTSAGPASGMDVTRANSLTALDAVGNLHDLSPVIGDLDFPFDMDGNFEYEMGLSEYGNASTVTTIDESIQGTPVPAVEHEKRKSPPTDEGTPGVQEGGNKKRGKENGEEKVPKKPGRKPLTSEPTTKRKAQNRAAQRAFRERKEKHLKDLEDKVAELQKASESANKENSMLRVQIERLQAELAEYRKRVNDTKAGFSNILGKGSSGGFQFEFPMFGLQNKPVTNKVPSDKASNVNGTALNGSGFKLGPGTIIERQTPLLQTPAVQPPNSNLLTTNSHRESSSPPTTQQNIPTTYSSLFSTSALGSSSLNSSPNSLAQILDSYESKQHTPGLAKNDPSSSPSASTVSHHGTTSSCVTSPESSSYSPIQFKSHENLDSVAEEIHVVSSDHDEPDFYCGVLDDGETSFCEKLGAIACGNPRNPMPLPPDSKLLPNLNEVIHRPDPASVARRHTNNAVDSVSLNNTGNLALSQFRDYRDPLEDASINLSFFEDAFPDFAVGSPNRPASPATDIASKATSQPPKPPAASLPEIVDESEDDDDDGVLIGSDNDGNLMPCHEIWSTENRDHIQAHPKFGELDIDHLCTELHAKARCSESGVVVGKKDVEEALSKAGLKCTLGQPSQS